MSNDKTRYKVVQVDYLKIYEIENTNDTLCNIPFSLTPYLEKCSKKPVSLRAVPYKGEIARLQNIEKITSGLSSELKLCKNLWKMHFIRMRNQRSGVANETGEYSDTLLDEKLEDDQYLAESTACIYDGDKNLFIIARNRDSVLPSGILEFFIKMTGNNNLNLAIIANKAKFNSKKSKVYRRFCIGITEANTISNKNKSYLQRYVPSVYNALTSFKGFGFSNMYIELSMGDMPQKIGMSNTEINSTVLGLMQSDIENVKKLELKMKESEDSKVETIDLFTNKVKDEFTIPFSKSNKITYDRLVKELLDSYGKNIIKIK